MNLVIKHRVRLVELKTCGQLSNFVARPIPVEMILRDPGNKRLRDVITALNRNGIECSVADPSSDT